MTDFTYKFPDEATARAALFDENGQPKYRDVLMGIHVTKPTGNMIDTPDGPVPETTVTPGYHVNIYDFGDKPELAQWWVDATKPTVVRA